MSNNYETPDDLVQQFEDKEAGVAELMELYENIEAIYVKALHASSETPNAVTSNSANSG